MKELALKLPGFENIPQPDYVWTKFGNLGGVLSGLLEIAFYIAAFLAFYFLVWGAFQYILARGNKENLAKARSRITWALVGLLVVFLAYFIARFASEIFPPTQKGLPF